MTTPILILTSLLIATAPVSTESQNHRDEITDHVVDRCYNEAASFRLWLARRNGHETTLTVDEIVDDLKRSAHTNTFISNLVETVRGHDATTRMRLYDIAYVECFLASVGEMHSNQ